MSPSMCACGSNHIDDVEKTQGLKTVKADAHGVTEPVLHYLSNAPRSRNGESGCLRRYGQMPKGLKQVITDACGDKLVYAEPSTEVEHRRS